MAEELPILYRDEHIVVIDKPPNLLVHRSEIDRHETRFAIQILRDQIGQYVWPAHRLDRGTSGVLLFGLNREIASLLGRQFDAGTVEKRYWAVVRGFPPAAGSIDHAVTARGDPYSSRRRSMTKPADPDHFASGGGGPGRRSRRTLQSRYALLELDPVTRRLISFAPHRSISPTDHRDAHRQGRHNRYRRDLTATGCCGVTTNVLDTASAVGGSMKAPGPAN